VSVVWKEETVVFVRDRVRVERTALGIVGGQNKVVEAVQDEARFEFFSGFCRKLRAPHREARPSVRLCVGPSLLAVFSNITTSSLVAAFS
jgi:hypothetical protein